MGRRHGQHPGSEDEREKGVEGRGRRESRIQRRNRRGRQRHEGRNKHICELEPRARFARA